MTPCSAPRCARALLGLRRLPSLGAGHLNGLLVSSTLPRRRFLSSSRTNNTSSSSSSSSSLSPEDERLYAGNGGTIEGVWLFHRHGDRTPSRPLVADHRIEDESTFWRTRIPPDRTVYDALSRRYPARVHASNGSDFLDAGREPYGFLTYRGMDQMRTAGRRCARRYARYGHQAALRDEQPTAIDEAAAAGELLRFWDVRAASTNYLRTVKSAQCFLDGLVGGGGPTEDATGRYWDGLARSPYGGRALYDGSPPSVTVRDRSDDTLNAFDRNPDLMQDLVAEVVSHPDFQAADGARSSLAARLAHVLPGLARHGRSSFPSPSGINWIHAADHFVCRSAHAVPFARYSAAEEDDDNDGDDDEGEDRKKQQHGGRSALASAEEYLKAASRTTLMHLAYRFRCWYSSAPLLAAVAAPPLREIETGMREALALDVGDRRPFQIYSCHDVTILGLLYGVGASFLSEDQGSGSGGDGSHAGGGGGWKNFWPPYASTLIFELVRVQEGKGDPDDTHVVRILLNGKTVAVRPLVGDEGTGSKSNKKILRHGEFSALIDNLEAVGGWGEGGRLVGGPEGAEKKRDMSGWTG